MSDVKIPKWLQKLVKQVTEAGDWPNGKYPEVAKEAWNMVMEYGEDGQLALLQTVIDEVERIKEALTPFTNVVGGERPGDTLLRVADIVSVRNKERGIVDEDWREQLRDFGRLMNEAANTIGEQK